MAKKKQNKPVAAAGPAGQKAAERKPTKKEKKAIAEQRSKELKAKRKKVSLAALLAAGAESVFAVSLCVSERGDKFRESAPSLAD